MVVVLLNWLYYWIDTFIGVRVELMDKKQEQMARDAQKANYRNWTIDDFFEAVLESTRKTGVGMVHALNGVIEVQSWDFAQIYGDYAKEVGKDELTKLEKQQAILNHVLEQGLSEEA